MSAKEEAPTREATRAEAAEQVQASRQGHASKVNFNTAGASRQIQIKDFLLTGAENAVPRRHLQQLTGLSDRDLRRRIQAERLGGVPILSDCENGYFLPDSPAETKRFVQGMNRRADEIRAVAAAVEQAEV